MKQKTFLGILTIVFALFLCVTTFAQQINLNEGSDIGGSKAIDFTFAADSGHGATNGVVYSSQFNLSHFDGSINSTTPLNVFYKATTVNTGSATDTSAFYIYLQTKWGSSWFNCDTIDVKVSGNTVTATHTTSYLNSIFGEAYRFEIYQQDAGGAISNGEIFLFATNKELGF